MIRSQAPFSPPPQWSNREPTGQMERPAASGAAPKAESAAVESGSVLDRLWQEESMGFGDVLDMVNPLQHLPVIGSLYRQISGDEIGHLPRLVGGVAFGGLLGGWAVGLASSASEVIVKEATGQDLDKHLASWLAPAAESSVAAPPGAEVITATASVGSATSQDVDRRRESTEARNATVARYRGTDEPVESDRVDLLY